MKAFFEAIEIDAVDAWTLFVARQQSRYRSILTPRRIKFDCFGSRGLQMFQSPGRFNHVLSLFARFTSFPHLCKCAGIPTPSYQLPWLWREGNL